MERQGTILEYSRQINTYAPSKEMESILKSAFLKEFQRLDHDEIRARDLIKSLEERRIIQTGPHLIPSYGPRMLCLDWQSSIGAPDEPYIVGMFSGIPFSNSFYPGRISFGAWHDDSEIVQENSNVPISIKNNQKEISLVPATHQDDLVYRSEIDQKTRDVISQLREKIKNVFDIPSLQQESYTKWSLQSCQSLMRTVLKRNDLFYFDLNEVVTHYLIEALQDTNHIMHKIFFEEKTKEIFIETFSKEILFLSPVMSGKYLRSKPLFINDVILTLEELIANLKENRLCPGAFLCFTVFSFLNHFKCFGSFRQVEYLPAYKQKWLQSGLLKEYNIENAPCTTLTTGSFPEPELQHVRPIDIIMGTEWNPNPDTPSKTFL